MKLATWLVIATIWAVVSLGLSLQAGLHGHRGEELVMGVLFVASGTTVVVLWKMVVDLLESGSKGEEKTRNRDRRED